MDAPPDTYYTEERWQNWLDRLGEEELDPEEEATAKLLLNMQDEVHHSRLYPNLDELADKGLVEKGERDRRTNYYTLTPRGTREIEARREWEDQYVDL